MPGIKLKLDGKPLDLHPLPPRMRKLKAMMDGWPADELFTNQNLMGMAKMAKCTLADAAAQEIFAPHTRIVGTKRYWGSAAAIKELDRQLGAKS